MDNGDGRDDGRLAPPHLYKWRHVLPAVIAVLALLASLVVFKAGAGDEDDVPVATGQAPTGVASRSDPEMPARTSLSRSTTAVPSSTSTTAVPPTVVTPPPATRRPARVDYLDDLEAVEGCCWSSGVGELNGRRFERSLMFETAFSDYELDFNLGRRYETLRATVGARDDSPAETRIGWRIEGDGVELASGVAVIGAPESVRVSVSRVLRLRLIIGDYEQESVGGYVVFGDARVSE